MRRRPERAVVDNPSPPVCLSDWEKYKKLERAASLARRYGHVVALLPFAVAAFVAIHYEVNYSDVLIYTTLGWAGLVALVGLFAAGRALFISCPSCGLHFGPGKSCQWCGFPRYRDGVEQIGNE
jgi:hypothetical protein